LGNFVGPVQRVAEVSVPDQKLPVSVQEKKDIVICFEEGEKTSGVVRD
jgi:hypothetical protein